MIDYTRRGKKEQEEARRGKKGQEGSRRGKKGQEGARKRQEDTRKRQERARSLKIHFINARDDSCILKYRGKTKQDEARRGKKGQEA